MLGELFIEIQTGEQQRLTLPQAAVLLRDGFHFVYRLNAKQELIQSKVSVGPRHGSEIAILSGLKAGERVVDSGVGFLNDGDRVRVVASPTVKSESGS